MTRKSDYTGDRFGNWYVESRATPLEGKRRWHCVNTVSDERRLVLQTDLKNLADEPESDMPTSAEITAKVVTHNFKDDPFNLPDGILPDDDSEYPFEPEFIEPNLTGIDDVLDLFGVAREEVGLDESDDCDDIEDPWTRPSISGQPIITPWEPQPIEDAVTIGQVNDSFASMIINDDLAEREFNMTSETANKLVIEAIDQLAEQLRTYMNEAIDNWRLAILRTVSSNA